MPNNYYLRSDGSDSNSGTVNSAGGAWLTLQYAIAALATVNFNGSPINLNIGAGTYAGCQIFGGWVGGPGSILVIKGDNATPSNVVIGYAPSLPQSCITLDQGARIYCEGVKFENASGSCIGSFTGSYCGITNKVDFGACAFAQVACVQGGNVEFLGDYNITGGAAYHVYAKTNGVVTIQSRQATISGTPAFTYFAGAFTGGVIDAPNWSASGQATGTRYLATLNGVVDTGGGGANFFPGNSAGQTATGGQYA
jgi:hypothetical protein